MASARDAFLTKRALLPSRPPRFEKGSTFQPLECQFQVPDSISCDSHETESDLGAMRPASGALRVYSPISADQRQDRKRVVMGKSVSVRVDLGGGRIITKKNKN